MIEKLIARVFATRNAAHLYHWRTPSYAQHQALSTFYEGVIDKIDGIVEAFQGTHPLVNPIPELPPISIERLVAHMTEEAAWIAESKAKIADGSPSVANLIDDLHGLYASTLYKLKHLH